MDDPIPEPAEPTPADPGEGGPSYEELLAALAERDARIAAHEAHQRELLDRVRAAMLTAEPDIDPDLVQGATLAELEASFESARELVSRIRKRVAGQLAASVPAGAPGRAAPPAPASAMEKIRAGLAAR
ncbi:MAG: hypothetical protein ACM3S1_05750 [Hyphomicrobiales bacterium]